MMPKTPSGGKVGINTTTPSQTLTVQGTLNVTPAGLGSTPSMFVNSAGNVGIGITNPTSTLHVVGTLNATGVVTGSSFTSTSVTANGDNNVATTIYTLPDSGTAISLYIVSATITSPSASPANYAAYAIIAVENGATKIMTQVNGGLMTITLSGMDVQVTQSSGGNQDFNAKITRVA